MRISCIREIRNYDRRAVKSKSDFLLVLVRELDGEIFRSVVQRTKSGANGYTVDRARLTGRSEKRLSPSASSRGQQSRCSRLFLVSSRVVRVVRGPCGDRASIRLSLICRPPVFPVLSARGIPWKLTIDPRERVWPLICLASSRPWRTRCAAAALSYAHSRARDRR